jgi:hypothetical protein
MLSIVSCCHLEKEDISDKGKYVSENIYNKRSLYMNRATLSDKLQTQTQLLTVKKH